VTVSAPALVGVRQKSRWHPSAVDASVRAALQLARECPDRGVPAFHAGEVVGLVRGTREGALWTPLGSAEFAGFDCYDTLNNASKNGRKVDLPFSYGSVGVQHNWMDLWAAGGFPVAGDVAGTANTLRQFDNTSKGGLFSGSPTYLPSGAQNFYLCACEVSCSTKNTLVVVLYDRVASYDQGSVTTGSTSMTNTLAAQRYVSAGNPGLLVAVVSTAALGATAANLSAMHFTDNAGNTGVAVSAGYTMAFHASNAANEVCVPWDTTNALSVAPWIPLTGGVSGVRKVEDYTSSAVNTGTLCFVLMHPVGFFTVTSGISGSAVGAVQRRDLARTTYALEKVFSTACLSLMTHCQATQNVMGKFTLVAN
jgi:hypothetical protein